MFVYLFQNYQAMFSLSQIEKAQQEIQTGADFPNYIQKLKKLGVLAFETWVSDSHTIYFGTNDFSLCSNAVYAPLSISEICDKAAFLNYLKNHQAGNTDYPTFCQHCALTGIEKWKMDLEAMTCTYFSVRNEVVLVELIQEARG
jgi:uncharacterized protein YbcV (DUF1398 family)